MCSSHDLPRQQTPATVNRLGLACTLTRLGWPEGSVILGAVEHTGLGDAYGKTLE